MKLVSYDLAGTASYGLLRGNDIVDLRRRLGERAPTLKTLLAAQLQAAARRHLDEPADARLSDVTLLPLIPDPALIACVGHNYEEHRIETERNPTKYPSVFLRQPESLQGAGQPLLRPIESTQFDFEGELALVIGKGGRRIPEDKAWDHVAGVTCFNEGSVRDWQRHTGQFTPGKNFPRTGAFGPALVTLDELPADRVLELSTRVNGQRVQHAHTDQLIFPVPVLLAYISTFATLQPGDVIVTGTPGGVGARRTPPLWLQPGDLVEVEISHVGLLANRVEQEGGATA
jgi:2-keto-4-pentenoate hydratase/2-oxohepta-3-ene-1,7-dioic acid hydratase in catechol pathway